MWGKERLLLYIISITDFKQLAIFQDLYIEVCSICVPQPFALTLYLLCMSLVLLAPQFYVAGAIFAVVSKIQGGLRSFQAC